MNKIIIIGALPDSLINFRGTLIKTLRNANYQITAMASEPKKDVVQKLDNWAVDFKSYNIKRNSLDPISDLKTLFSLHQTFRKLSPKVIFAYTIKPIIWGSLASRGLSNTHFYALVTGLGFAFHGKSLHRRLLAKLVIILYRKALKYAEHVIFQNPDNLNTFVKLNIVPYKKCSLVNGSGVDVNYYKQTSLPNSTITFLAIGRLLGEKGFYEYAQAAQIVKKHYPEVIFQLLGPEDSSPDGIPLAEIKEWHQKGWLEYLGSTNDVRPYLQKCHVYVLPSYHEGMPRTVLEAMSTGRPIITTDVPGCRETVIPGENGYLVPKENAQALAERIVWFIQNRDKWTYMGKRSRELAEEKYDVHKVNAQLMKIMGL